MRKESAVALGLVTIPLTAIVIFIFNTGAIALVLGTIDAIAAIIALRNLPR